MTKTVTNITNLAELESFVIGFAQKLSPKENKATVITLSGNLGAGKTTFCQHLGRILGVSGPISSPTFVISKTYPLKDSETNQGFQNLVHIDAYRLESEKDLDLIGFTDASADASNLIVVEWPSLVNLIGDSNVTIEHGDENEDRVITFERN